MRVWARFMVRVSASASWGPGLFGFRGVVVVCWHVLIPRYSRKRLTAPAYHLVEEDSSTFRSCWEQRAKDLGKLISRLWG